MKKVVIFEVEGGNDKGLNGHRHDTVPIQQALSGIGITSEIIFYRDEWQDQILQYMGDDFGGYISRVNPGNLPHGELKYFELLDKLSTSGLVGMSSPKEMMSYGAKDALVKIKEIKIVPDDTYAYYKLSELESTFPKTLKSGIRVLKQNRGSTGSGIWKVELNDDRDFGENTILPLDVKIKITEAIDNHQEYTTLGEFINFCKKYINGKNGMIVDTPFMPRIVEGEIRILYVGEEPIFVVHKKPAAVEGAFSATLFSGAKYTYKKPEEYKTLVRDFEQDLPKIKEILGHNSTPLIWTADFMLDTDKNGNDTYVLGEINCSCVGFTSHLDQGIQEKVAQEVKRRLEK